MARREMPRRDESLWVVGEARPPWGASAVIAEDGAAIGERKPIRQIIVVPDPSLAWIYIG